MAASETLAGLQVIEQEYDRTVRQDIELFRSQAEAFLAGQLTDDQFRAYRLRRGIYGQRQPGVHMVRTKVPGGRLTSRQRRQLASDHAAEHAVPFCAAPAGAGFVARAGGCAAYDSGGVL